jgi:uncharacterized membrane protein
MGKKHSADQTTAAPIFAHDRRRLVSLSREMIRRTFRGLALGLFLVYLAVFPGSTLTVALDRVPGWGEWMGGALLLLQGAIVLFWLAAGYGPRGALAAGLVAVLAWGVEHLGVVSGFPFGRYRYTDMLQPQLLGVVPLAIPCAWLMVALGAWQLATAGLGLRAGYRLSVPAFGGRRKTIGAGWSSSIAGLQSRQPGSRTRLAVFCWPALGAATLVLLLDLQIETIATAVNRYWVWLDGGAYYGVPTANFVAWWLVGLGMAAVVGGVLGSIRPPASEVGLPLRRAALFLFRNIPACLYLLNTLMFSAVNLARGYAAAGLIGAAVLCATALALAARRGAARGPAVAQEPARPDHARRTHRAPGD